MPTNDSSLPAPLSHDSGGNGHRPIDVDWVGGPLATVPEIQTSPMVQFLHGLRRHWLLASALGISFAALFGGIAFFFLKPTFTAVSLIQVSMREHRVAFETDPNAIRTETEFDIYKNTQRELLRSRFVLNAALRRPDAIRTSIAQDETIDPVEYLQEYLSVYFPGDAEIMQVSLRDYDKNEVNTLVSAVVQAYMDEIVDRERDARRRRLSELDFVCNEKENELRSKRVDIKRMATQLGTGDTEALTLKQQIALETFSQFRQELTRVNFQLMQAEGALKTQRQVMDNAEAMEVSEFELELAAQEDTVGQQLLMVLAAMRQRMAFDAASATEAGISTSSDRRGRDLMAITQQYEARKEELRDNLRIRKHVELDTAIKELEAQVAILREQSKQIAADVETLREDAEKIGESSVDLELMRGEYEQLSALVAGLADERDKLKVELRSNPRVQLWQRSEVPKVADDPTIRYSLLGFITLLGFSLPVCGVALWDIRTQRINSSSEVAKRLGLTVFGSVPMIPDRAIRKLATPSRERKHWHGRLTESVDGIAARLLRKASVDGRRVVLVSSAVSGEGKTTLATQLAMSLARSGRKTALVDFDLRRPVIERIFGLPLEPGISNVLREEATIADAAQETAITNLHVIPAGRLDQEALVALSKGGDRRIFESLRKDFDFVVVDGSPVLPVADTRFLTQNVDTVILSILRDVSQGPKVVAACEMLESFGSTDVGVVVAGANEDPYSYDPYYRRRMSV